MPAILSAGLLLSDDVTLPERPAFLDFCESHKIPFLILGNRFGVGFVREKSEREIPTGPPEREFLHHADSKRIRTDAGLRGESRSHRATCDAQRQQNPLHVENHDRKAFAENLP